VPVLQLAMDGRGEKRATRDSSPTSAARARSVRKAARVLVSAGNSNRGDRSSSSLVEGRGIFTPASGSLPARIGSSYASGGQAATPPMVEFSSPPPPLYDPQLFLSGSLAGAPRLPPLPAFSGPAQYSPPFLGVQGFRSPAAGMHASYPSAMGAVAAPFTTSVPQTPLMPPHDGDYTAVTTGALSAVNARGPHGMTAMMPARQLMAATQPSPITPVFPSPESSVTIGMRPSLQPMEASPMRQPSFRDTASPSPPRPAAASNATAEAAALPRP